MEDSRIVSIEALNSQVSLLSVEAIERLSDDQIKALSMERPVILGQHGFLLDPQYFRSPEHMAEIMRALMVRLVKAEGPSNA